MGGADRAGSALQLGWKFTGFTCPRFDAARVYVDLFAAASSRGRGSGEAYPKERPPRWASSSPQVAVTETAEPDGAELLTCRPGAPRPVPMEPEGNHMQMDVGAGLGRGGRKCDQVGPGRA